LMIQLKIDRRQLIRMGVSSGLLAALPVSCVRLGEQDAVSILGFISDSALPVDPGCTGTLNEKAFDVLAGLCAYIDRGWGLSADLGSYVTRLRGDLDLKTGKEPSYLTEYEHAAGLARRVRKQSETSEQAWSTLLFSPIDSETPESTGLGRARRLVFAEIVTHQVALSGGFRSFGLLNYRGWAGGPFADPESYRREDL